MALKAARRKKLRSSQFGLPKQRKYPVDTRGRAISAKGRAKQQMKKGNLSRSSFTKIVVKANRRLKRGRS